MPTRPSARPRAASASPPDNPRFGQDFRDLYLSAHLPIFTERGMDFKIGRMNTIIGYNGFLAPYRPFYSSDYQFFYSQDGAFTGFLTNLHVSDRLEVWNGMTLGANTFFVMRSAHSYCYIGQVNYWLTDEKKTRLTGSVYAGPDAIFAAPGMNGTSSPWWSCDSSRTGRIVSLRSSRTTWAGTSTLRSAPAPCMACTSSASST